MGVFGNMVVMVIIYHYLRGVVGSIMSMGSMVIIYPYLPASRGGG